MVAKKKVLVVGGNGNMGKRYCCILNHLGHEAIVDDVDTPISADKDDIDCVIIATPTDTHYELIKKYHALCGKPILCEKPISKNLDEVKELCEMGDLKLQMVDQYWYLYNWSGKEKSNFDQDVTIYDYYNSGKDGIYWDCINLIKRSTGYVILKNESPKWKCYINSIEILKEFLDISYISMIEAFVEASDPANEKHEILEAHERVIAYIERTK